MHSLVNSMISPSAASPEPRPQLPELLPPLPAADPGGVLPAADCDGSFRSLFTAWIPRWGRNHASIIQIGLQALRTKACASGTSEYLLRPFDAVSDDLASEQQKTNPFWEAHGSWGNITIFFEGYLAEPTCAAVLDWDLTRYAAYAWKCGQRDTIKDIIAHMKKSVDEELFKSISGPEFDIVKWGIR